MKESRELIPSKPEPLDFERQFEPQIVTGTGRYPAYRETYAQEGLQLLDYWRAIRKRIWLVIGIAVLVTTLAAIYMARKPNIYAAKAVIQVDLEQTNQDLAIDRQRPISTADPSYFNTQLQLLDSDTLLRRVIKEHNLDTNAEFQKAKNEGSTSPWRSLLKSIGLASEESKKEDKKGDSASAKGNSTLVSAEEIAEAVRLSPYVEIIKKNLSVDPVRDSRVTVKDTRLIEINYSHTDPELAAFIANGIGETFSGQNQEKRGQTSRKTSDFLQTRISDLQGEIRSGEDKLVELKKSEGILKTTGEQTIVLERLGRLNTDLLTAENDRKNAEAEYFSVKDSPEKVKSLVESASARYISEKENEVTRVRNETLPV